MNKDAGFHEWALNDLFKEIRGITSRAMFGGYAFYLNGVIFAIIADGRLYFKADEEAIADFKKYGSGGPFHYSAKDRSSVTMGYWELPEEIMEDPSVIATWVRRAAATKKRAKKKVIKKKR